MLLEQGTSLTFGHPTPDAELDPIVQGIGAALRDDRAVPADHRSFALGGATDEQLIRIGRTTQSLGYPRDPGVPVRQWR